MFIHNGAVTPALVRLVQQQSLTVDPDPHPHLLNEIFQRHLVETSGSATRARLCGKFPSEEEKKLLRELGSEAIPVRWEKNPYDGVLILGSTMEQIARRMKFITDEFEESLTLPNMWFLGSERPIDVELEGEDALPRIERETGFTMGLDNVPPQVVTWPSTETEVFLFLQHWSLYRNSWWRHCDCYPVNTPIISERDGDIHDPNTADTVKCWLESGITSAGSRFLVVSSQPFCEYQLMAVKRAAREVGRFDLSFTVCGPEAPPLPLDRWLDAFAKQLWEEIQILSY